jgi:hypothetical protein
MHMKNLQLLAVLIMVTAVATGCSLSGNLANNAVKNGPTVSATGLLPKQGLIQDVLAGSHNRWYRITSKTVPKVGSQYGVTSDGMSQGPGGITSDALPPGTTLYTIPGIDPTKQAIAVPYNGKYYEADLVPTNSKNLGWIHVSNGYYSVSSQPVDNIGKPYGVVGENSVTASALPDGTKLFAVNNVPSQDPHGVGAIAVQTKGGSYVTAFWFGNNHP